jgi:hypothetical protein
MTGTTCGTLTPYTPGAYELSLRFSRVDNAQFVVLKMFLFIEYCSINHYIILGTYQPFSNVVIVFILSNILKGEQV